MPDTKAKAPGAGGGGGGANSYGKIFLEIFGAINISYHCLS